MPEILLEKEEVPVTVADGVKVGEAVPETEAPEEIEGVPDGVTDGVTEVVGEGEGNITPATYSGPAYIVPALVTLFHAFVVKVPTVAPVHTLTRERMP